MEHNIIQQIDYGSERNKDRRVTGKTPNVYPEAGASPPIKNNVIIKQQQQKQKQQKKKGIIQSEKENNNNKKIKVNTKKTTTKVEVETPTPRSPNTKEQQQQQQQYKIKFQDLHVQTKNLKDVEENEEQYKITPDTEANYDINALTESDLETPTKKNNNNNNNKKKRRVNQQHKRRISPLAEEGSKVDEELFKEGFANMCVNGNTMTTGEQQITPKKITTTTRTTRQKQELKSKEEGYENYYQIPEQTTTNYYEQQASSTTTYRQQQQQPAYKQQQQQQGTTSQQSSYNSYTGSFTGHQHSTHFTPTTQGYKQGVVSPPHSIIPPSPYTNFIQLNQSTSAHPSGPTKGGFQSPPNSYQPTTTIIPSSVDYTRSPKFGYGIDGKPYSEIPTRKRSRSIHGTSKKKKFSLPGLKALINNATAQAADEDSITPRENKVNIGSLTITQQGVSSMPSPATPLSGIVKKNPFEIHMVKKDSLEKIRSIGSGASSSVFLVRDKETGEYYAMKCIKLEEGSMPVKHHDNTSQAKKMIYDEIQQLYRCRSCKYMVKFIDAFYDEKNTEVQILLEYVDGFSLAHLVNNQIKIPDDVLGAIAQQILRGLSFLHHKNIVHMDIKPENILVTTTGNIKFCDFGLVLYSKSKFFNTSQGTQIYFSPERINGKKFSFNADIWSLGITLFELATQELPFDFKRSDKTSPQYWTVKNNIEALPQLIDERMKAASLTPHLSNFIKRCLTANQFDRPSAKELLKDIFVLYWNDDYKVKVPVWPSTSPTSKPQYENKQIDSSKAVSDFMSSSPALSSSVGSTGFNRGSNTSLDSLQSPLPTKITSLPEQAYQGYREDEEGESTPTQKNRPRPPRVRRSSLHRRSASHDTNSVDQKAEQLEDDYLGKLQRNKASRTRTSTSTTVKSTARRAKSKSNKTSPQLLEGHEDDEDANMFFQLDL